VEPFARPGVDSNMIHSPGPRLPKRTRRPLVAEIGLTSLVDVLVVLVVFGLQMFEGTGELLP
jgi:hypothetical protein